MDAVRPRADVGSRSRRPCPPLPSGEGIGLSIVKRLCKVLDAPIELEAEPGHGMGAETVRIGAQVLVSKDSAEATGQVVCGGKTVFSRRWTP